MKTKFVIVCLFLSVSLFSTTDYQSLLTKLIQNYSEGRVEVIDHLESYTPNDSLEEFCKYYLLSFCYYDFNRDTMQKVPYYIYKSAALSAELSEVDRIEAEKFVIVIETMMSTVIKFSEFTYDDLYDVTDLVYDLFIAKTVIDEHFMSYRYAVWIKNGLMTFQQNVMKNRERDKFIQIIGRLDKVQTEGPDILIKDTRRND